MSGSDDLEERLSELARRTEALRPGPGFGDRVLRAVAQDQSGWVEGVLLSSRKLLPFAVVLAALCVGFAVQSADEANEALAVSYGATEFEW